MLTQQCKSIQSVSSVFYFLPVVRVLFTFAQTVLCMKAIVITQPGGPEVLQLKDYPSPSPASEEVLIEVKAAGINRADIFQRQGNYPPPPGISADIPGLEVAGIVMQCGEGVTQWKPGDKVCALLAGGGYAEQVAVKEGQCLPIPKGFDFAGAAALPETIHAVALAHF